MAAGIDRLTDVLFDQLERLNAKPESKEGLDMEIARAKAINDTAKSLVSAGAVGLQAARLAEETFNDAPIPKMLMG